MSRKKKNKQPSPKKESFSNNPFKGIKQKVSLKDEPPEEPVEEPEAEPTAAPDTNRDEENALYEMMHGAKPVTAKPIVKKPQKNQRKLDVLSDDELVVRHLDELVYGIGEFDVSDSDEYIEAHVKDLDRRILKKLKHGDYAIQAHLDLHGLNKMEAREEVATFINNAYGRGFKCVLIVHGRGLGSENKIPVLKEKLKAWLTRGAMGKKVLAYTSAKPYDGGTGAIYVLLRS